jgi:hypothetical protein
MRVAIHQPNYLPYPGFFAKLSLSDVFVIYDTAQFTRGDFINRNRIRTFSFNEFIWLTLPVGKRNFKGVPINQVEIRDKDVFERHSRILRTMYSKAPFFDERICEWVRTPHQNLAEHNFFLIERLVENLNMKCPKIVFSSELNIPFRSRKTQALIDIIKAVKGDEYISGSGAKNYLEEHLFQQENINLAYLNYEPIKYPQIHPGFVENMSVIDAIFNIGWEETIQKIKTASKLDLIRI